MPEKGSLKMSDYQKVGSEMEQLYAHIQKYSGLSDAEYWCMMAIHTGTCQYQHEICNEYLMSKQTVSSALKQLVKKGYIRVVIPENNQRIRQIVYTEAGNAFAKKHLDVMQDIENRVWSHLMPAEQNALVAMLRKINDMMRKEIEELLK